METVFSGDLTITDLDRPSAFGNGEARGDSPKDVTPPPSYRPLTPITTDPLLYNHRFGTDYTLPGYSEINSPRRQSQPLTVEQLYVVNEFGVLVPVQIPGVVGHFLDPATFPNRSGGYTHT